MRDFQAYINDLILKDALALRYNVADQAPSTEIELFNSTSLTIWSGASDNTIFGDASVNWAFRALHDALHLKTGLGFTPEQEIELGRRQAAVYAAQCQSLLADLVYCEVAEQAKFYQQNGSFLDDQVKFTVEFLSGLGYDLGIDVNERV